MGNATAGLSQGVANIYPKEELETQEAGQRSAVVTNGSRGAEPNR